MKRPEYWFHDGSCTLGKIKKDTGATRVLVPVQKRVNVPGTSLFAWSLPGALEVPTPKVMWKFVWEENQKISTIIPVHFLANNTTLKAAHYRIVDTHGMDLWVEARSSTFKYGKSYTRNKYLLVFEDVEK